MSKNSRRMISVSSEWEEELEVLKKDKFYNSSYAEMYRYLLRIGLDNVKTYTQTKSK